MGPSYFNHYPRIVQGWWDRQSFIRYWWRIYAGDSHWVPPYYPTLRRALNPAHNSHLARMSHVLVYMEALPRKGSSLRPAPQLTVPLLEEPVAAVAALGDPRRRDGTAYLGLLRCVNDAATLHRLLDVVAEQLWARGYRRVIGPTGLSPHLGSGSLQDHWSEIPPLHTPYNPPYLPEVLDQALRPLGRSQLYHLNIPSDPAAEPALPAELSPFDPLRLSADLLPLLAAACPDWADFVPPDSTEAAFLTRWLARWPLHSWLAVIKDQPVGFMLLQPDLAADLRRAKGGRNPLWRLWLAWRSGRRPLRQGRILFAAVMPAWQGQGIGRQLLHQACKVARRLGWQRLSIGPLPRSAPGIEFLQKHGARPRQTYLLYRRDL